MIEILRIPDQASYSARWGWLRVAVPLLAFALVGCTAGTGNTPSDAGSKAGGSGISQEHRDWELKFTRCLQSKGLDIPDPDPVKGAPGVKHDDAYNTASASCEKEVGPPPASGAKETDAEVHERALKKAACLRENGINVPDPKLGEPMIIEDAPPITEDIDKRCGWSAPS